MTQKASHIVWHMDDSPFGVSVRKAFLIFGEVWYHTHNLINAHRETERERRARSGVGGNFYAIKLSIEREKISTTSPSATKSRVGPRQFSSFLVHHTLFRALLPWIS